jgi:hypothetical protein
MMFYANADFGMYKTSAMRAANIPGWEKDVTQAKLKDFRDLAAAKMPPLDTKYKIMQK